MSPKLRDVSFQRRRYTNRVDRCRAIAAQSSLFCWQQTGLQQKQQQRSVSATTKMPFLLRTSCEWNVKKTVTQGLQMTGVIKLHTVDQGAERVV